MLRKPIALLAALTLLGGALSEEAFADDPNPLGFYAGASLGGSWIDQGFFDEGIGNFRNFAHARFGWKVLMGARPLAWLGAELEYIDFGNASLNRSPAVAGGGTGQNQFYGAHASATAGAGFLVGYLPLPAPWMEAFGKLGVARLQTRYGYSADYPSVMVNCPSACSPLGAVSVLQSATQTDVAYGAGAQVHFGPLLARLEYERIGGTGHAPSLLSLGFFWDPL